MLATGTYARGFQLPSTGGLVATSRLVLSAATSSLVTATTLATGTALSHGLVLVVVSRWHRPW